MSSKVAQQEPSLLEMRAELIANTITARLKLVVLAKTPEKRRFPLLEELTGVSENTWRTWWKRGGTPSGALVEGVARAWPEYAFWLATGITDVEYGHRMPELHISTIGIRKQLSRKNIKKREDIGRRILQSMQRAARFYSSAHYGKNAYP